MRAEGVTIVLVSQSPEVIASRCDRALWLKDGRVQNAGGAKEIAAEYDRVMRPPPD